MIVLIQRGWQAGSGLITLYLVTRFLGPVDQGVYYTISTLVGMMLALDMGLTNVLVPLASKYSVPDHRYGDQYGMHLLGLGQYAARWFLLTGLLMLLVAPLGAAFLTLRSEATSNFSYVWYAVILGTAALYMLSPIVLLLEGIGSIEEVYRHRLYQGVLASLGLWTGFYMGAGLLAAAIPPLIGFFYTLGWVLGRHAVFVKQLIKTKSSSFERQTVWRIQWRTGASIFIGYLLVFAYTPMYYLLFGATEAGRIGLTMACVNTIFVLAVSGLVGQFPTLTRLLSESRFPEADKIFKCEARKAETMYGIVATVFMLMLWVIRDETIAQRFMSLGQVFCVLVAMFFYLKANALGYFLGAHLRDRALLLNLVALVMVVLFGWLLSLVLGTWGIPVVILVAFAGFLCPAVSRAVGLLNKERPICPVREST